MGGYMSVFDRMDLPGYGDASPEYPCRFHPNHCSASKRINAHPHRGHPPRHPPWVAQSAPISEPRTRSTAASTSGTKRASARCTTTSSILQRGWLGGTEGQGRLIWLGVSWLIDSDTSLRGISPTGSAMTSLRR